MTVTPFATFNESLFTAQTTYFHRYCINSSALVVTFIFQFPLVLHLQKIMNSLSLKEKNQLFNFLRTR